MCNDVEHGGISTTNVKNFFKSLNAGWIIGYLKLKGKWKAGFEHIACKLNLTIDKILKMSNTDLSQFRQIIKLTIFMWRFF